MSMRTLLLWIERALWFALCVTLLWQTRVVVWTTGGLQFVEWKAIALYATDLLLVGMVLFALAGGYRPWRSLHIRVVGFLAWLLVAVTWSQSWILSVATLVRVVEVVVLALYVRDRVIAHGLTHQSVIAFCVGALGQAVLAVTQYVVGRDTGLRWLGETVLDPSMKGVAVFLDQGERVLRAYGTLPHPNVLAFALCCALALVLWHWSAHKASSFSMWVHGVATGLLTLGVLVTFSRAYLLVLTVVVGVGFVVWARRSAVVVWWTAAIVLASFVFCVVQSDRMYARMVLRSTEEAVALRVVYAQDALLSGGATLNWFGVGAGAYVPWLERAHPGYPWYWYQPTHAVPLLLYAELGIVGIALLGWVISSLRPRRLTLSSETSMAVILCIAIVGVALLADHFLWTLQQGRLLVALGLGVVASVRSSK